MGNSLLAIKPHQVSRDLKGYSVMFYGEPKSGKTTTASRFPDALVLAFEKGYSAIPGIMAKPINSWAEFKKTLTELKDEEVKRTFLTVVIDTADIAYGYCEKFICARESEGSKNYDTIADIPFGKGYKMAQQEFDECIRRILQMDYGLVLISHSTDKTFKDEQGNEYNQIIPTLDSRARLVCERTCDIIGYSRIVTTENGENVTKLFLRGTPRFVAGSRFKYTPPVIDFTYDNLVNAISDAIDEEAKHNGNYVTSEKTKINVTTPTYDFSSLMNEVQDTIGAIMHKSPSNANKITEIIEYHLGKGKKVTECTSDQAQLVDVILFDLKQLV